MSTNSKKTYLLDTNVLIDFAVWIPIPLNSIFWSKLEDSLKNGEWILLDEVVNEIKFLPELQKWCKKQKQAGRVSSISNDDRNRAVVINTTYPMIDSAFNSTVDTYIIAYAEANKLTIFSRESPRKNNTALHKIPDTCAALKIDRIAKPQVFLTDIGFNN